MYKSSARKQLLDKLEETADAIIFLERGGQTSSHNLVRGRKYIFETIQYREPPVQDLSGPSALEFFHLVSPAIMFAFRIGNGSHPGDGTIMFP